MLAARWELVGKHKSREHCRRDCVTRATVAEAIDVEYVTGYPTQTAHGGLSSFSFSNFVPQALYKRTAIGGLRSPVDKLIELSKLDPTKLSAVPPQLLAPFQAPTR